MNQTAEQIMREAIKQIADLPYDSTYSGRRAIGRAIIAVEHS